MIDQFKNEYYWASNFATVIVYYDGEDYPTIEHAFQAAKTLDPVERQYVRSAGSPGKAKRRGRKVTLRPDWEDVKFEIMLDLNRQKYAHASFQQKLLATGDEELVEGNDWDDEIWGVVLATGKGQNLMGKILMQIRQELQHCTDQIENAMLRQFLTPEEFAAFDSLADTATLMLKLPTLHPMEREEVCHDIHKLQMRLLARPGLRALGWPKADDE